MGGVDIRSNMVYCVLPDATQLLWYFSSTDFSSTEKHVFRATLIATALLAAFLSLRAHAEEEHEWLAKDRTYRPSVGQFFARDAVNPSLHGDCRAVEFLFAIASPTTFGEQYKEGYYIAEFSLIHGWTTLEAAAQAVQCVQTLTHHKSN